MCSAMLLCPQSSPRCLLGAQRACPAAVTAQQPLGNLLSNRGDSAQGRWGITLLQSSLADSRPRWGVLDLPPAPSWQEWTRRQEALAGCVVPGWGQPGLVPPPGALTPLPRCCRHMGGLALAAPVPHSRAQARGALMAPAPPSLAWLAPCPSILRP